MATQSRKLEVTIVGDASRFNRTLGGVEGRLGGFRSKVGSFATGVAGGFAAAFAVDKLIGFGGEMLNLGTKLAVYEQKTNTVFEGAAESVNRWADANNEAFGMSDEALAGAAAGFGDLMKPMGFTADQAASMSTDVVGLAGALSAWSGGTRSAAEVSEILGKAMLGERDSLKELGISISEADVQARLAEKGQQDLTGAALAQAEALATQELLFEKSTDAQQAWADGSMDAIKNQNELKAAWEDGKAALAGALMPAFAAATEFITGKLLPAGRELLAIFHTDGLSGVMATLGDRFREAWPGVQAALGEMASNLWAWIQEQGPVMAERFVAWSQSLYGWIAASLPPALEALGGWIADVGEWLLNEGLPALHGWLTQTFIPGFVDWVKEVVPPLIVELWKLQGRMLVWIGTEALPMIAGKLVEWGAAFVGWIWPMIEALPGNLWNIARFIGQWIVNDAAPFLLVEAGKLGEALVGWIVDMPGRIAGLANGMWDGIWLAFRSAVNLIIGAWNGLEFKIPGFDPPGPGPTFAGITLGVPDLPMLARGGVIDRPTLAVLGDGTGSARREIATPENLMRRIVREETGGGSAGPQIIQVVMPDGRVLAEATVPHLRRMTREQAR